MQKVDEKTLEALLELSRLSPESCDTQTLKEHVDRIVEYFGILKEFDTGENTVDAYAACKDENLRDDKIVPGLEMHDVKHITHEFMDGYFRVPKVLE